MWEAGGDGREEVGRCAEEAWTLTGPFVLPQQDARDFSSLPKIPQLRSKQRKAVGYF